MEAGGHDSTPECTSFGARWAFVAVGCLLALALFPTYGGWATLSDAQKGSGPSFLGALLILAMPLFPLALALMQKGFGLRLSALTAKLLSVLVLVVGGFMTLLFAMFSGAGGTLVLLEGTTLTLASIGAILALVTVKKHLLATVLLSATATVAIFSLATVPRILWEARSLAEGDPYCIADHGEMRAVEGLAELRGLSFYSQRSGFKMNQVWYFHGVMIVSRDTGPEFFNWSPRAFGFDRIEREHLLFSGVDGACAPVDGFAATLEVY